MPALSFSCGDSTDDPGRTPPPAGCPGNANVAAAVATPLVAGATAKGYLCPAGNQQWFSITVPAGQKLVSVDLHNDTTLSAVQLQYTLRGSDGSTVIDQSPPPRGGAGRQLLQYTHCVPGPGTYYLQVQSYTSGTSDDRNPYTLSYTTAADPNTPARGTKDTALPLTGAPQTGYLSCKGNRDFYKITVPDNTLLDLSLSTAVPTPSLSLKYTLYQLISPDLAYVVDDKAVNPNTTATNVKVTRSLPGMGTYYVVVEDQTGTGSDLKNAYTLQVKTLGEPDANDRPTRNDTPDAATALGSYSCGGGMSLSKTGLLASRGDVDWYKITLAPPGGGCVANLQVSAAFSSGGSAIQPQVALVYPDPASPCTKDADCRSLTKTCNDGNGCEYLGNQCDTGKCTGAAVCLPEKQCGVLQFVKQTVGAAPNPSVSTSQPLGKPPFAGTSFYLRVRDFQSQGYDSAASYNLGVQLEPDDREPNHFYTPYVDLANSSILRGNATFVAANKIALDTPVSGRIGFERDRDYYFLDHPCPGANCTLSVTYSTSAASRVLYTFQMETPDGKAWAGWPAPPASRPTSSPAVPPTKFGDGTTTCLYASSAHTGPYVLWVADLLKLTPVTWDLTTRYTFTVHKEMDGCSTLCQQAPYNCGK